MGVRPFVLRRVEAQLRLSTTTQTQTQTPLVANRSNTSQQKQHKNEVTCKFSPRPPFFKRGFMPCPGAGANKEAAADGRQPLPSATRRRLLTVLQRVLWRVWILACIPR